MQTGERPAGTPFAGHMWLAGIKHITCVCPGPQKDVPYRWALTILIFVNVNLFLATFFLLALHVQKCMLCGFRIMHVPKFSSVKAERKVLIYSAAVFSVPSLNTETGLA